MTEPLSPLEQKVYHYLIDFLAENTYQPSIRDIARKFRIKSTKTVSDLLHALAVKGYIQRDRARSRGVKVPSIVSHVGLHHPKELSLAGQYVRTQVLLPAAASTCSASEDNF